MKIIILTILIISSMNAKQYENYNIGNFKIISDSKIYVKNNLLISNSRITGRFYSNDLLNNIIKTNGIYNIKCNLDKNRYNVVDDCSMLLSKVDTSYRELKIKDTNLVYLGEMNAKKIKNFNYKTHMIECDYNKKHGVMHDCQIKLYKQRSIYDR